MSSGTLPKNITVVRSIQSSVRLTCVGCRNPKCLNNMLELSPKTELCSAKKGLNAGGKYSSGFDRASPFSGTFKNRTVSKYNSSQTVVNCAKECCMQLVYSPCFGWLSFSFCWKQSTGTIQIGPDWTFSKYKLCRYMLLWCIDDMQIVQSWLAEHQLLGESMDPKQSRFG